MADYGRGNIHAQQSSTGGNDPYNINARSAESYLSGQELSDYRNALSTLQAGGVDRSKSKKHTSKLMMYDRQAREAALQKAERLRNIAATRGLGDFAQEAIQYSKPWLVHANQGLISQEPIKSGLSTEDVSIEGFGPKQTRRTGDYAKFQDVTLGPIGRIVNPETASATAVGQLNQKFKNLQLGQPVNVNPDFYGNYFLRKKATANQANPNSPYNTLQNVTNPQGLYAGMTGGMAGLYRR